MEKNGNISGMVMMAGLAAGLLSGCATTTATQSAPAEQPLVNQSTSSETATKNKEKAVVVPDKPFLSGKVTETISSGGYTYVQLENDGKKAWFAVPATTVNVGQEVEFKPGMQMGLFKSRTLNKSFESIVFAPGLVEDQKAVLPAADVPSAAPAQNSMPTGHPALNADPKAFEGKATKEQLRKAGIEVISGKVLETMDSGGYTYILIACGDKKVWGAVPTMEVKVGQEVELLPGQTMTNFNSKSLNKTFDSVIFSTGAVTVTK
ncbi:MAG TPA: hypothetical protein HPP94_15340 [Desulfuromonadales bacterium]|nr:hypothetical protein [Desulfuromonadales bacterium]